MTDAQWCSNDADVESALTAWASYGQEGAAPPEQQFAGSRRPRPMDRFIKPAAARVLPGQSLRGGPAPACEAVEELRETAQRSPSLRKQAGQRQAMHAETSSSGGGDAFSLLMGAKPKQPAKPAAGAAGRAGMGGMWANGLRSKALHPVQGCRSLSICGPAWLTVESFRAGSC